MVNEKRKSSRHAAITEVAYEQNGIQFQGRISDLSSAGFFIDNINCLRPGSLINFRFSLPGDTSGMPIAGEGRVAYVLPLQGMGIHITALSVVDQSRLKLFIAGTRSPAR